MIFQISFWSNLLACTKLCSRKRPDSQQWFLECNVLFFTSQWQGIRVFFEPSSDAKAAEFLKAYLCASCLVLLQGTKDTGAIQLAALSVMQREELCCTGCVAWAVLRNWSCVYLLPVIGYIFKAEKGCFPLQDCWCSLWDLLRGFRGRGTHPWGIKQGADPCSLQAVLLMQHLHA